MIGHSFGCDLRWMNLLDEEIVFVAFPISFSNLPMFKSWLMASILIGACACMVWGQSEPKILDEVTVTATRTSLKQSLTGKVVSVIPDSVLRHNGGKTLSDLLNQQAGITIVGANGPLGTNQDLYVRGAGVGYTLILLDGTPMYDPSTISSNYDLNQLPVDQIERIEILKGGHATIYGADAVAAVVNIITKNAQKDNKQRVSGGFSGGSWGTYRGNIGYNASVGNTLFDVQYSKQISNGFSTASDPTSTSNFAPNGFGQDFLRGSITQQFKNGSAKAFGQYSRYKADLDYGPLADEKDFTTTNKSLTLGANLNLFFGENNKHKLSANYQYNNNDRLFLNDSTYIWKTAYSRYSRDQYLSDNHIAEVFGNFSLSKNIELLAGLDFRKNNMTQLTAFGDIESKLANTNQKSVYTSLLLKDLGIFGSEIGVRLNDHSVFGSNVSYTINPYIMLKNGLKIFTNVSSSYRVPGLYQLFSPYGNNKLKPEIGQNFEAGLQYSNNTLGMIRATYFSRNISDVIDFAPLNVSPFGQYVNQREQSDRGLEIEATLKLGASTSMAANYTYITGEGKSSNGKDLPVYNLIRRPKDAFNFILTQKVGSKVTLSLNVRHIGKREDRYFDDSTFETKSVTLDAYTLVNIYGAYKFSKNITTFIDLQNIGDTKYAEVFGYNTRNRNVMAGINFNF
jgi:vitamin B12 transporter